MKKDHWAIKAFALALLLSLIFGYLSNTIANHASLAGCIILLIIIIAIGVLADTIGCSVLGANEKKFHAMSAQKVKGSKKALYLIKNSDKISNICNDIIGDICGILSGSLGTALSILISIKDISNLHITVIISAIISALTIGGKALCKKISVTKADDIIYIVGKILSILEK